MIIKLVPVVREGINEYFKSGNTLSLNGVVYDFSRMNEGDTLPVGAITSEYFSDDVIYEDGHLIVSLRFDIPPKHYSQEQAFPEPLLNVPDGPVKLPDPLPPEPEMKAPVIDQEEAANE